MRNLVIVVMAAVMAAVPFEASASLQSTLNNMFMTNVTQPGAYNSATRGGFVGGGIVMRTPIKPINLVSFDPPRINAGCGGIDLYMGSFSYINKAEFTQVLRSIMNNAIGLMFNAALQSINPSLAKLLNDMQNEVKKLNEMFSNTCNVARAALTDTGALQAAARVGTDLGITTDHSSGMAPGSDSQALSNNKATEASNPLAGNFTWKALSRTNAADQIGYIIDPTGSDPNGYIAREFLMSLIGTTITSSYTVNTNAANDTQPLTTSKDGPLFQLTDLLNTQTPLSIYTCMGNATSGDTDQYGPNSCTTLPTAQQLLQTNNTPSTQLDFAGTMTYVRNMLYGDDTQTTAAGMQNAVYNSGLSPSNPGPNSIYGKLLNGKTALTPQEQSFVMQAGPVFNIIKDAQADPSSLDQISPFIEAPLALASVIEIGQVSISAVQKGWIGVADAKKPAELEHRLVELQAQINMFVTAETNAQDNLLKARKIADEVRKAVPAPSGT